MLDRHRLPMQVQDHADMFTNFELDNDGQLVFTRFARLGSGEYIYPSVFCYQRLRRPIPSLSGISAPLTGYWMN